MPGLLSPESVFPDSSIELLINCGDSQIKNFPEQAPNNRTYDG